MTRIGFVADVHCGSPKRHGGPMEAGINRRGREILRVLEAAVTRAAERGCKTFVVLGDLLDDTWPAPQLLAQIQDILDSFPGRVLLLLGNHEQVSTAAGDHALGPLQDVADIVAEPTILSLGDASLALVPFRPAPAKTYLPDALKALGIGTVRTILGIHAGIIGPDTPPWLLGAHDALPAVQLLKLMEEYKIETTFAGNWHNRREYGSRRILQVGALVPTGWDNPGLAGYGTLAVWDSELGMQWEEISGPRFVKMQKAEELPLREAVEELHRHGKVSELYLEWAVPHGELESSASALESLGDLLAAGTVVPNAAALAEAKEGANKAAGTAGSLPEALANYIAELPVDDGVDRASVLARARGFLGL